MTKKAIKIIEPAVIQERWLSGKACRRCGVGDRAEPHACPLAVELRHDYTTTCTCCASCRKDCALEV